MSKRSSMPPLRNWFRVLISGKPHQIIGGDGDLFFADAYMHRWYLIPRNRFVNIYLHKFLRSDDDRALHDHPWWFVSLILKGQYDEMTKNRVRRRRAGSVAFRPAQWRHRVVLLQEDGAEVPCWTVIVTGRRQRMWGFWCRRDAAEEFVPWEEFDKAGCGEV